MGVDSIWAVLENLAVCLGGGDRERMEELIVDAAFYPVKYYDWGATFTKTRTKIKL
jgi:hypothetical protein